MAQRTRIELLDDLDGGPAEETIVFGLDGKAYEIDLSTKNAAKLRDFLTTYVNAGRKVSGTRRRRGVAGTGDAGNIRAWAQAQGLQVSSRGRVSAEIRQAYDQAHS
ncbi:MAG: Lsr2 family protein [Propionibacteriaceae bacterium]|nr:Lsr2 family protein [Propionibacteriaceae bacterium]